MADGRCERVSRRSTCVQKRSRDGSNAPISWRYRNIHHCLSTFPRNKWANGRFYGTPRGAAGYPCHLVSVGATGSLHIESIPREAIAFDAVGVVPANRPAIGGPVCWRGVLPDELSIPCWSSIRGSIRRLRRTRQRPRALLLLPQPLLCRSDRGQRRVRTRRGLWLL